MIFEFSMHEKMDYVWNFFRKIEVTKLKGQKLPKIFLNTKVKWIYPMAIGPGTLTLF